MSHWRWPVALFVLAANCGLEPVPPVDPAEQDVRWCLEDDPHAQVKDMGGFYKDLIGLAIRAREGASEDRVKPRRRLEERKEFQLVSGQCRWLAGNEYVLTLVYAGLKDGWVCFEPVGSTPFRERLAKWDLVQNDPLWKGYQLEPAILPVFDFSGRNRGTAVLERLPAHLRREGLPPWRVPAKVFPPDLLRALEENTHTFRLHLRVISSNYVIEKQEGDFTTLLLSARLRSVLW
jgi:hypothetical protein